MTFCATVVEGRTPVTQPGQEQEEVFVPKTRASSKTVQNHHWKGLSLQSLFPSLSPLMAALRCRLKSPARSGRTMCLLTPVFPFLLNPLSPQSTTPLPPYLLVFATPLPGMPATRPTSCTYSVLLSRFSSYVNSSSSSSQKPSPPRTPPCLPPGLWAHILGGERQMSISQCDEHSCWR